MKNPNTNSLMGTPTKTAEALRLFLLTALLQTAIAIGLPSKAQAYFSTFDTANTLEANQYQLGLEGQYIFNTLQGGDIIAHYSMGIGDGQELKFVLGSGIVNFQFGGFYKLVPIPDTENQPAVGGFLGLIYSSIGGQSYLNFRFHPLISKTFKLSDNHSVVTPYASIPIGVTLGNGMSTTPIQLELGAEWLPPWFKNIRMITELGFNINATFSYFSAGLTVPFESFDTIKLN